MIGTYEGAADVLAKARTVAVVAHLRPDADAIGSAVALSLALKKLGKQATAHVGDLGPVPENLRSIPGAEMVEISRTLPEDADLIVTVDCGSLDRTGVLADEIAARMEQVLVIDHHASNQGFGAVNLIDRAESTTTVLRRLFELLDVELDYDIAHCLYAGLMTDTGSFRWGTPGMHSLASELMSYGLDTRQIAVDLLDSTTANDLQMIGRVLSGLQVRRVGSHSAAILIADVEAISGHSDSAVESLVDFVRALEGSTIGAVFKEQAEGYWAVSLRSSTTDVSQLAVSLGGGGHVPAAGYVTKGPREAVVTEFLQALGRFS